MENQSTLRHSGRSHRTPCRRRLVYLSDLERSTEGCCRYPGLANGYQQFGRAHGYCGNQDGQNDRGLPGSCTANEPARIESENCSRSSSGRCDSGRPASSPGPKVDSIASFLAGIESKGIKRTCDSASKTSGGPAARDCDYA